MNKRALILGVSGQDGSYLAEYLIAQGYEVHGMIRRSSSFNTSRIDHLYKDPHDPAAPLKLHYGDVMDASSLRQVIEKAEPHELYNLAAQSHVRVSFDMPEYTADATGMGALRVFEAVRQADPRIRVYQASSSEMFGSAPAPQEELTPFHPRSPYGCAKVFAHHAAVNYREAYGMYIACGILFNHESERRAETFVTRKITRAVGRIKAGLQEELHLGNLEAWRDWGHAEDYVVAMHVMLQQTTPEDFVIGTGESHTVVEFVGQAFARASLGCERYVRYDRRYDRPSEVHHLRADIWKAKKYLGWHPRVTFEALVHRMVDHDVALALREKKAMEGR